MSRIIRYTFIGLLMSVALGYSLSLAYGAAKIFFDEPDKNKTWISIERYRGTYAEGLDLNWVVSIFRNMEVKVKLKTPYTNDNDKLDLAYEVKANLSRPILSKTSDFAKVDYRIEILFKFIDEDGFVIASQQMTFPDYTHETLEKTNLLRAWEDEKGESVTIRGQLRHVVDAKVATRIEKIGYTPEIVISNWELKKTPRSDSKI